MHLTATAYLAAATKEIPVDDDASSIIAGWGPDTTLWLRGEFGRDERADVPWRRDGAEWSIDR
ncbi:hypothetical protein [Microbacterium marinilacus]|uniref:hypothetical protein n=1 Tax=Microbacterium marinilacus TaxID=415209 RepID=UPI001C8D0E7D|nr:hypothetical protein [Microbacterium marinilacus]MBY0689526.1 hypothetical protein [Microbacterium marinilacus]